MFRRRRAITIGRRAADMNCAPAAPKKACRRGRNRPGGSPKPGLFWMGGCGRELTVKTGHAYNPLMSPTNIKTDKLERDIELVSMIAQGDQKAWEIFVESFTNWVLYKAKEWCVGHCPYSAGEYFCGLTSLSLQRQGQAPRSAAPECDEGLDTYIWIFEQLKRRVGKYTGKNDCLLSTFVWTILNSKELHIDWLRWKYGRVF